MSTLRTAPACLFVIAIVSTACRDRQPESRYNYDLSEDEDVRLLPTAGSVPPAHDVSILQSGNTTATIFKRDELEAAAKASAAREAVEAAGAVVGGIPPATSVGEALGNVGSAFLRNLMGGTPPTAGATEGESAAAAEVNPQDSEAIQRLVEQCNAAYEAKDLLSLPQYCVARQRAVAQDFFDLRDELRASFRALLDAADKATPGVKANAEAQLEAVAATPVTLSGLSAAGPDHVTGTFGLARGTGSVAVHFEREDGQWRLVHPFVPDEAAWPNVKDQLTNAIEDVDNLVDSTVGGTVASEEVEQIIKTVVTLLSDQVGG